MENGNIEGWATTPPKSCGGDGEEKTDFISKWRKAATAGFETSKSNAPSSPCECRVCPDGWTSLGGFPDTAACYPSIAQEEDDDSQRSSFELVFSLKSVPIRKLLEIDENLYHAQREPILSVGNDIALVWAEELSAMALWAMGSPDAKGVDHYPVRLVKPVYAMNALQHDLLVAEFSFKGAQAAELALIELLDSAISSLLLDDEEREFDAAACSRFLDATKVDFCGLLRSINPRYHLKSLALQEVTKGSSSSISKSIFSAIKKRKKDRRRELNITLPPTKAPNTKLNDLNKCKSG